MLQTSLKSVTFLKGTSIFTYKNNTCQLGAIYIIKKYICLMYSMSSEYVQQWTHLEYLYYFIY